MKTIRLAILCLFAAVTVHAQDKSQVPVQDNPTVRALFVEDLRDRGVPLADDAVHMLPKPQADKLPDHSQDFGIRDVERLKQVKKLVNDGSLRTALDFYHAALLLQHGAEPDDYLLAHILAIRAVGLGYLAGQGLAAVTLDRYLQSIGRGQVFGSQYLSESYSYTLQHAKDKDVREKAVAKGEEQTLLPYNETLVPDSLRHAFCVASLAEQKKAIEDAHKTKMLEQAVAKDCDYK